MELSAYLIFNLLVFGHAFIVVSDAEGGFARGSLYGGLPGLLISPSRGLLIFSPVFLFAAAGIYLWFREGRKWHPEIYGTCLLVAAVHLVVIARWRGWPGGYNYGPRLLTDVVPCLVILMIPALRLVDQSRGWRLAFASALLFSVTVQAIGVFFYPNGRWDALPQPLYQHRERVWDWEDNQILRTVRAGPVLEPLPTGLRLSEESPACCGGRAVEGRRYQTLVGPCPIRSGRDSPPASRGLPRLAHSFPLSGVSEGALAI